MEENRGFRKNWIDAAKGIAILIVVLNHSGLVIPGVNFWGGMFYVPAFFLLAGYTYAIKEESYKSFVKRKAKRLLVPYFATNILLAFLFGAKELLTGNFTMSKAAVSCLGILYGRTRLLKEGNGLENLQAWVSDIRLMPNLNAPTWFLPALFLVLICGDGLFRLMKGNRKKVCLFTGVFALMMLPYYYLSPFMLPWCLDILPYLLGFFLTGYELKEGRLFERMDEAVWPVKWGITAGIMIVTAISSLYNGSSNLSLSFFGKTVAVSMISAVSSSCLLFIFLRWADRKAPRIIKFSGRLSKYTLTILCWHYFVMQMFYGGVSAVMPGIWEEPGVRKSLVQLGGIVLSVAVCVTVHFILMHRHSKEYEHSKEHRHSKDHK